MKITTQTRNIFTKAFQQMPSVFISHQFNNKCREYGLEQNFIENDNTTKFLKSECNKLSRYGWQKNNFKTEFNNLELEIFSKTKVINDSNFNLTEEIKIENAIKLLKGTGKYKISIVREQWIEI